MTFEAKRAIILCQFMVPELKPALLWQSSSDDY